MRISFLGAILYLFSSIFVCHAIELKDKCEEVSDEHICKYDGGIIELSSDWSVSSVTGFTDIKEIVSKDNKIRNLQLVNIENGSSLDPEISISGILFANVQLVIENPKPGTKLRIKENVFLSSWGARIVSNIFNNSADMVLVRHTASSSGMGLDYVEVTDNVFLRVREVPCLIEIEVLNPDDTVNLPYSCYPAASSTTYEYLGGDAIKLHNIGNGYVARNLIGGSNPDISSLSIFSNEMLNGISTAAKKLELSLSALDDSNSFETGISINNPDITTVSSNNFQVIVSANIINGSPDKGKTDSSNRFESYNRDHAVYFGRYNGIQFCGNYLTGWPEDGDGGAKFRNAVNTVICDNIFDRVPLLMFVYEDFHETSPEFQRFDNAYIYGNAFDSDLAINTINGNYRPIVFAQRCDFNDGGLNECDRNGDFIGDDIVKNINFFNNTLTPPDYLTTQSVNDHDFAFIRVGWRGANYDICPEDPVFTFYNNTVLGSVNIRAYQQSENPDCTVESGSPVLRELPETGFQVR